jgi:glycosyltransferase involved in cell wall biosynthesis
LYERGLADLLDAGNAMAAENIRLTIAVPFLRDTRMRKRLRREIAHRCPTLDVVLQEEVDPYALFQTHDVFAFPYRRTHSVFVPTSLLEAMSVGIPVIAANHKMYHDLTVSNNSARCGLHRVGDSEDLTRNLFAMRNAYNVEIEKARMVSGDVRREWTVERAADELLAGISSLKG